ncbi:FAD:protein FMN transferase [Mariniflexile maritimum]|uniref:FAD:protein FMN transferase n=1 Tax=Mariniflexile maritimum TaxID=2682493 RepID=UPI001E448817|nr:FAD:protein FMN transferase [Mariniflexile maritimum]
MKNTKLSGVVFGTSYHVVYHDERNFETQFDSLFTVINNAMSTYQTNSDISRLNRNETTTVDAHFIKVFNASKDIYKQTEGVFDPTIGGIVNAWDFGPEVKIANLDSLKIDSLMQSVGLNKVTLVGNNIEKPQGTFIDFNAIAKGYGVDVIGEFLESKQVKNYLVEIGGEIRARGTNKEKQAPWKVGIEMPHFDGEQSILEAIEMHDEAMATSGTYRKFKTDAEGNRYAHIIDTKTGYPSKTNLLSISVIAENCMVADGYATAFKAMGIEKVKTFLKKHPELKVFLIFENDKKQLETLALNNFPKAK